MNQLLAALLSAALIVPVLSTVARAADDPAAEEAAGTDKLTEARRVAAEAVANLRGAGFEVDLEKVSIELATPAQYRRDLLAQNDVFFGPEYFTHMARFLHALGMLPTAEREALVDAFLGEFEQAALAYYQADRDTFVFLETESLLHSLASLDLLPLVTHELVHALQDQQERLEEGFTSRRGSIDQARAYHMLLEGEAELLSLIAQGIDPTTIDDGGADELSALLGGPIATIYSAGRRFLTQVHAGGGSAAVLATFADPPTSTEQILHPRKHGVDLPTTIALPPPPEGTTVTDLHLGELSIRMILEGNEVGGPEAFLATTGWDGDTVRILAREGEEPSVLWVSVWDRTEDAEQFVTTLGGAFHLDLTRFGSAVVWAEDAVPDDDLAAVFDALKERAENHTPDPEDVATTAAIEAEWIAAREAKKRTEGDRWVREDLGLSIPVLEGWELRDFRSTTGLFLGEGADGFIGNITVQSLPSGGLSLDVMERMNREQLSSLPGIELVSMGQVEHAGRKVLRYEMKGNFGAPVPLHGIGMIIVDGDRQIVLTGMGTDQRWGTEGPLFEEVFSGIRFLGSEEDAPATGEEAESQDD